MFEKVSTIDLAKKSIAENQMTFVYIGHSSCSVCHGLKPQIEQLLKDYDDIVLIELDSIETPEVAEAFQVFTVPVMLLFVEGKEYLRKARIVNTKELAFELEKIVSGVRSMT